MRFLPPREFPKKKKGTHIAPVHPCALSTADAVACLGSEGPVSGESTELGQEVSDLVRVACCDTAVGTALSGAEVLHGLIRVGHLGNTFAVHIEDFVPEVLNENVESTAEFEGVVQD